MAESPDAQSRLTVTPATDSGRPARSAAIRATFRLSSPAWLAQPEVDVLDLGGLDPGTVDGLADDEGREVVGPNAGQRAAVAPDRRADGGEDDRSGHQRLDASRRSSNPDGRRERADRLAAAQELRDGLATLLPVVLRELVDIHRDEAVRDGGVDPAPELERVLQRLGAMVERALDRVGEHLREVAETRADVASRDDDAERQRQPGLEQPPLAEVEHLLQAVVLEGELALVNEQPCCRATRGDLLRDLLEGQLTVGNPPSARRSVRKAVVIEPGTTSSSTRSSSSESRSRATTIGP